MDVLPTLAGVVKLVDTRGLGPRGFGREGSSPFPGTCKAAPVRAVFLCKQWGEVFDRLHHVIWLVL